MFLNDVGGSYRLKFTQEESDSFHAFFAGGVDSMTIEHFQDGMPKMTSEMISFTPASLSRCVPVLLRNHSVWTPKLK